MYCVIILYNLDLTEVVFIHSLSCGMLLPEYTEESLNKGDDNAG